jgi:curved DNA-binding protein CbpA
MHALQASLEEIKSAWRRQALRNHPDRCADDPQAAGRFRAVQHAWEVLRDTTLRAEYDKHLLHELNLEVSLSFGARLRLSSLQQPVSDLLPARLCRSTCAGFGTSYSQLQDWGWH